jgi:hypothetical protein
VGVALLVVALVGLLIVLGNNSGDDGKPAPTATTKTTPKKQSKGKGGRKKTPKKTPAAPQVARLELLPTGPVWVCLRAAGDRVLLAGEVITPDSSLEVYRSRRFTMTLANGSLKMKVNGKTLSVPDVQDAIGYEVDRTGKRTVLAQDERPTCA